MNDHQQAHIDYYLRRLEYWQEHKPAYSTARMLERCEKCGFRKLQHVRSLMQQLGPDWKLTRCGPLR